MALIINVNYLLYMILYRIRIKKINYKNFKI